jgi:hypothetical protein
LNAWKLHVIIVLSLSRLLHF